MRTARLDATLIIILGVENRNDNETGLSTGGPGRTLGPGGFHLSRGSDPDSHLSLLGAHDSHSIIANRHIIYDIQLMLENICHAV